MVLLVVASPCALVIATPATILSAIANAARNGILFKGGRFIEALGRVRAVAFDKTGTLTHGRFEVTDVVRDRKAREEDVLSWAAAAETRSQHPLAQAVVRAAEARRVAFTPAEQLTSISARGWSRRSRRHRSSRHREAVRGARRRRARRGAGRIAEFNRDAKTTMLVHCAGRWGVIAAADQVRPSAAQTIGGSSSSACAPPCWSRGDSAHGGGDRAAHGVDEHHGALLPDQKVAVIGALEAKHGASRWWGTASTTRRRWPARRGHRDGRDRQRRRHGERRRVLMGDDLAALPYAVRLAQRARRVVIQNVAIASGVMVVLVTLVFLGQHSPFGPLKLPVAVSGHEGSTVIVILNGLRLLGGRRALGLFLLHPPAALAHHSPSVSASRLSNVPSIVSLWMRPSKSSLQHAIALGSE
jgi:Cd2+/Zn2+-exporting ATPase